MKKSDLEKVKVGIGDVLTFQGYFRGWTRCNDQLFAIIEKDSGFVIEVYHIYIRFLHEDSPQ